MQIHCNYGERYVLSTRTIGGAHRCKARRATLGTDCYPNGPPSKEEMLVVLPLITEATARKIIEWLTHEAESPIPFDEKEVVDLTKFTE